MTLQYLNIDIIVTLLASICFAEPILLHDDNPVSIQKETIVRTDNKICGLNALFLAAFYADHNINSQQKIIMEKMLPLDRAPFSVKDLVEAAKAMGFSAEAKHINVPVKYAFKTTTILHTRGSRQSQAPDHFIVCFGRHHDSVVVSDFPSDSYSISIARLTQIWDGDLIEISQMNYVSPLIMSWHSMLILLIISVFVYYFFYSKYYRRHK